jgi:dTDP-4-amino-4,6-dideoxygalactose transaminase
VKYHHDTIGYNSRLDPLQAKFLSVKLPHLDAWNADRRKHARRYLAGLTGLPVTPLTTFGTADEEHVHHLFVIRSDKRDELQTHLQKQGIESGIHYPFAIHQLGFAKGVVRGERCPEAERLAKEGLSLPMFPELTDKDITQVVDSIRDFFRK